MTDDLYQLKNYELTGVLQAPYIKTRDQTIQNPTIHFKFSLEDSLIFDFSAITSAYNNGIKPRSCTIEAI